MPRVTLTASLKAFGRWYGPGTVLDLDTSTCASLMARGAAKLTDEIRISSRPVSESRNFRNHSPSKEK